MAKRKNTVKSKIAEEAKKVIAKRVEKTTTTADSTVTVVNVDAGLVQRITLLEQRFNRLISAIDKSKSVRGL